MTRSVTIGDPKSARERVITYVDRVQAYTGKLPSTVVAFAEDYDALDLEVFQRMPYRVVRGPSVQEYRWPSAS